MDHWTLEKEFKFEASHQLPHHDGKCARLHGHSWKGKLYVEGEKLHPGGAKQGMLIDYADISAAIEGIVEGYLDHRHLNDSLDMESPTSELIAQWIYKMVVPILPQLAAVRIEETCTSACVFRPMEKTSESELQDAVVRAITDAQRCGRLE